MLLKPLDLLRTIGWNIVSFIFSLIDIIFDILKEINAYDIINSLTSNKTFINLHHSIFIISITLFGLFIIWTFIKKIGDYESTISSEQILKEIFKCGTFIFMTTFLFSQISTFSIQLSGFTGNIFENNNSTLSNTMLSLYIDYSDSYKISNNTTLNKDSLLELLNNNTFSNAEMYNEKFVTNSNFIIANQQKYVYSVNWIMSIIIGGFFLYSLFFSGMMLARRQIEFLFLFIISPIVFSTSVGNKQRRTIVIEQLVSLTLQSAIIMLIINLTILIMNAVLNTTFFDNAFKDVVIKSIMFIGCGSFLLTGSQIINKFIGNNISANNGREQLMSLMGFGNIARNVATTSGLMVGGTTMLGIGTLANGSNAIVNNPNKAFIGSAINDFGNKIIEKSKNERLSMIGNKISNFGSNYEKNSLLKANFETTRLTKFGNDMMQRGKDNIQFAFDNITHFKNPYRQNK